MALTAAGVLAGTPAARSSAAPCVALTGTQPPNPGGPGQQNFLTGVTVVSPCAAWAVGAFGTPQRALIVRWDGSGWTQPTIPDSGRSALTGVSAASARDVWAVGSTSGDAAQQTLILHWNGSAWTKTDSPSPGGAQGLSSLSGVRAISARDAWAVGTFNDGISDTSQALILHWDGSSWRRAKLPPVSATHADLVGVSASSARDVWAVGSLDKGAGTQPLIMHYDGSSWKQAKSPAAAGGELLGVRAVSATGAWAIGQFFKGAVARSLILHWDGSSWRQQISPNPSATTNLLNGIAATSARNAWAVGEFGDGTDARILLLHWDGSAWRRTKTPILPFRGAAAAGSGLVGVGASSPGNVWAVGSEFTSSASQTLALHCC